MSSRRNPFEEMERFFEAMSQRFDDASDGLDMETISRMAPTRGAVAVDLVEHDDEYVVTVDLPGFEREQVDATIAGRTLRIEADREAESEATDEAGEGRYLRRERRHESVQRSIGLPEEVDTEGVTARMQNGVLTVTLPRLGSGDHSGVEIDVE